MAEHYPASPRTFVPYEGFPNTYPGGAAWIARLGPAAGGSLGCGVATYEHVRTTWEFPFDELVYVLSGAMVVRASGQTWDAAPGDVLFFPRGEAFEYDVAGSVTVFYAKSPAVNAAPGS